eukprot:CAMPEP_0174329548 /NCGR_PEP_ID=MMETSP0810-20121108/15934_1 /TAXON_ID=73025 ORGANISM="Eutreptiella gymnastica-like, Strain CCMP1594" /NCGR_SAMPLE_ID=MMETSP0810 /ASSEMBLY_ACC=CAM_ASM_000659 /LENGTH=111 /DNA_ID=CAMNT_0015444119 /DNA_START=97 /DNA_END=433 /DNA_ORIENTATION=-
MKLMAYVQPMFLFTPLEVMQMGGGRGVQQTSPADTSTSFTDACLREAPAEQLGVGEVLCMPNLLTLFVLQVQNCIPPPSLGMTALHNDQLPGQTALFRLRMLSSGCPVVKR